MPIYVYRCPSCGMKKEVLQSYSESAPFCGVCNIFMTKQVTAAAGFKFKGSGFYQTDFKNK